MSTPAKPATPPRPYEKINDQVMVSCTESEKRDWKKWFGNNCLSRKVRELMNAEVAKLEAASKDQPCPRGTS